MYHFLKSRAVTGLIICLTCALFTPVSAQVKTSPTPVDTVRTKTIKPSDPKVTNMRKDSIRPDNTRIDHEKMHPEPKTAIPMAEPSRMSASDVNTIISNWPEAAKMAAQATIQKYGQPTESTQNILVWRDNGPWKKTVVTKEETPHNFPMAHKDVLQQTIYYNVPLEYFDDLARFDGSVTVDRTKGTLAARCDKEENNFLALNLANEIIKGKRSVDNARAFLAQTVAARMRGEKSEYTAGLMFTPDSKGGDLDKPLAPATKEAEMKKPKGSN